MEYSKRFGSVSIGLAVCLSNAFKVRSFQDENIPSDYGSNIPWPIKSSLGIIVTRNFTN